MKPQYIYLIYLSGAPINDIAYKYHSEAAKVIEGLNVMFPDNKYIIRSFRLNIDGKEPIQAKL